MFVFVFLMESMNSVDLIDSDNEAEFDRAVSELRDFIIAASTKTKEVVMTTSATQTGVGDEDNGKRCVSTPCVCDKCKEKRRRRKEKKEILRCVVSEKEDESRKLRNELAAERKANVALLKDFKTVQERLFTVDAELKRLGERIEEIDGACERERKRFKSDRNALNESVRDLEDTLHKKDERIAFLEMSLAEALSSLESATNFVQVLKGVEV